MVGGKIKQIVSINGVRREWLVDTGSQVTVITNKLFNEIREQSNVKIDIYELKNLDIKTANGSTLRCAGYSVMDLEINGRILQRPIIITSGNLGNEIAILGTNVLSELPEYKELYIKKEANPKNVGINEITTELKVEIEILENLFKKHKDVFAKDDSDLGHTNRVIHRIRVIDEIPVNKPYRRIPPPQIAEVKEHIEALLKSGIIIESQSCYSSPVVIVRKKDGTIRLCIDYRELNAKTHKDAHPIPRIDESFDATEGSKYFSTLDLQSAYNQIEVAVEDRAKTSFTTLFGLYEFTRMPFGLCNAPATFQRLMQVIFRKQMYQTMLCYLDDILIFSKTIEEHIQRLDEVFEILETNGLKLKRKKCCFLKESVIYLGHMIDKEGVSPDPNKIEVIQKWDIPRNIKELRAFIGFTGYYRKYVEKYAKIARPLHDLIINTNKELKNKRTKNIDIQGKWNEKCEMSFNKLKLMLTTPPVLGIPDYNQDFVVETDASSEGLGAVLSQHQGDKFKVIAYASRALSKGEKNQENYSSKKVELLAVKWAICDVFRSYLLGSKTTLYTDNNPLTYIFTTKKLPAIEQRWLSALASFDIEIKYRPAKSNINADVLSRKSFGQQLNEVKGIVDLQEVSMNTIATDNDDNKITICDKVTPNIGEEQSNDATITELIEMIQQNKKSEKNEMGKRSSYVKKLFRQWKKLGIVNNVLCRTIDIEGHAVRQVVVPDTSKRKCITEVHDNLGHQGMARCLAILRQ